jgi:putative acyl-CoA dehydrogenase
MLLGEPGKGLQTILQMVQMTRLDCTIGAAAGAKRSLQLALTHASTRSAFGLPLVKQPLMQNLLTDLCVVQEACLLSAMRMAAAHARSTSAGSDRGVAIDRQHESHVFRVGVAILKYVFCYAIVLPSFSCL